MVYGASYMAFSWLFTVVSVLLGVFIQPYWFIFTGIIGINQVILSFTGFCPMTIFLDKVGCKSRIE
jgi:hypothetical protein